MTTPAEYYCSISDAPCIRHMGSEPSCGTSHPGYEPGPCRHKYSKSPFHPLYNKSLTLASMHSVGRLVLSSRIQYLVRFAPSTSISLSTSISSKFYGFCSISMSHISANDQPYVSIGFGQLFYMRIIKWCCSLTRHSYCPQPCRPSDAYRDMEQNNHGVD